MLWKSQLIACSLVTLLAINSTGCRITHSWHDTGSEFTSSRQTLATIDYATRSAITIPFVEGPWRTGTAALKVDQVSPVTLDQAESMAAQTAPLAKVLDEEAQAILCDCDSLDPEIRDSVLNAIVSNSAYQKNLHAEKALLAYLGLAESYLQNTIATQTIAEIENLQAVLAQLQQEDLLRDVDPAILLRKKLEAERTQSDLIYTQQTLDHALKQLLGVSTSNARLWTACDISGWQAPTELDAELELAFQNRGDLAAIRAFQMSGNDQLLEMMRSTVRAGNPLAALATKKVLFGSICANPTIEIQKLRKQLSHLMDAQLEIAKGEIADSFFQIQNKHRQTTILQESLQSLLQSEQRLAARRQVGGVDIQEVLTVKSDLLKTRSEIISSAFALQREWVKMKARQGLLGRGQTVSTASEAPMPAELPGPGTVAPMANPTNFSAATPLNSPSTSSHSPNHVGATKLYSSAVEQRQGHTANRDRFRLPSLR